MKKTVGILIAVIILLVSVPASASERGDFFSMDGKKFWSLGINFGTSFATPLLIFNINATIAPLPYSFFEFGYEYGGIAGKAGENVKIDDVEFSSNYIYGRANFFLPYGKEVFDSYGKRKEGGGWYIGLGVGLWNSEYAYVKSPKEQTVAKGRVPTFDGGTGFYIGRGHILLKAGYGIRTTMDMNNLIGINHRMLLGMCYRIY